MINKKRTNMLFLLIMMNLLISCESENPVVKYIIPSGYTGRCIVFYEMDTGKQEQWEGGIRIYKFDDKGILKTQFPPISGVVKDVGNKEYFIYGDSNGDSIQILNSTYSSSEIDSNKVYIMKGVIGLYRDKYKYESFIVDKPSNIHAYYHQNSYGAIIEKDYLKDALGED